MQAETAPRRYDLTCILLLLSAGLLLRVWLLIPSHFDGLYGQDAYAYYDFAEELRSAVSQGRAPGPFFWPLGYPALLAFGFTIGGTQAETGQAVNILLGAGLAPLVYVLARQTGVSRFGALAAGVLMLVCGQALQSSLVLMSDIPALFWALVSAATLWRAFNRASFGGEGFKYHSSTPWLILSAVTLALACITRWIYLWLMIPWGLTLLIQWRGKIYWRAGVGALLAAGLVFLPQVLYSRTNPAPTLNHNFVEQWALPNAFQRSFQNAEGKFEFAEINVLFYARPFYDVYYISPLFLPFLLLGFPTVRQKGLTQVMILGGWVILPFVFLAGIPNQNIRFPLIVFPAVSILAGAGLQKALDWGIQQIPKRVFLRRVVGAAAIMFVTIGGAQTWNTAQANINTFITTHQRDKGAAPWVSDIIPADATLYTFGLTLTLKHYTPFNVYEIYYETPDSLAEKWMSRQDDYLLINVWNIENQWVGREPQIAFHWLRDERGLTELGKYGHYTLYRIRG